jgi:hypothetical protein
MAGSSQRAPAKALVRHGRKKREKTLARGTGAHKIARTEQEGKKKNKENSNEKKIK